MFGIVNMLLFLYLLLCDTFASASRMHAQNGRKRKQPSILKRRHSPPHASKPPNTTKKSMAKNNQIGVKALPLLREVKKRGKNAAKTPDIPQELRTKLEGNKLFGELPMRFRIRNPDIKEPVDFKNRFAFYNKGLYLRHGPLTPLKVTNLQSIYDPVPLKPKPVVENFYRVIAMPDEKVSINLLLEAAAEWHYSIGSKLGKGWRDPIHLLHVITQITEREQEKIFDSIKPPKVGHAWYEFASQRAHHDFRLNSAHHLCQKYLSGKKTTGTPVNALRLGFEQDKVRNEFIFPEHRAAAKFTRLTRYEMQERLLPGKFPDRIRRYEKRLSLSACPSGCVHEAIWVHALQVYFRTRIEQHFRTNVVIIKPFKSHPKFSKYPNIAPFTLNTVTEWHNSWMLLSKPVCPIFSYQAVWVMDNDRGEYKELHIIWGSPRKLN